MINYKKTYKESTSWRHWRLSCLVTIPALTPIHPETDIGIDERERAVKPIAHSAIRSAPKAGQSSPWPVVSYMIGQRADQQDTAEVRFGPCSCPVLEVSRKAGDRDPLDHSAIRSAPKASQSSPWPVVSYMIGQRADQQDTAEVRFGPCSCPVLEVFRKAGDRDPLDHSAIRSAPKASQSSPWPVVSYMIGQRARSAGHSRGQIWAL